MRKNLPALAVGLFGAALAGVGLALSQQGDVLAKAIRVCLECVGLG